MERLNIVYLKTNYPRLPAAALLLRIVLCSNLKDADKIKKTSINEIVRFKCFSKKTILDLKSKTSFD